MSINNYPSIGSTGGIVGYPTINGSGGGNLSITLGGGLGSSVNPDGSITLFASGPYLLYNSDPSIIGGKKLVGGTNVAIVEGSTSVTLSANVTGSGATSSGSYLTAISEGSLPQSRVATAGNGITITDGGAAGPMTFGVASSITGANILTWTSGDTIFPNRRQFILGSGLSAAYGTNTLTLSVTGQTNGTVTSIDVAAPASLLTSTGGPVITAGTITLGLTNASSNFIWAGPSSGGAGSPSYRALVPNDIPSAIPATKIGSGSVDNTEFAFLDGASANIQDQINNKQPYDPTLTALANYNSNGLMTQTAADTFTGRTITGQAGRISVTNGDGVSGNPLVDVGSSVYTIGGTDVAIADGGTGISTAPTSGQVLIGNSSNGYTLNTITPGSGIQITNGDGSITITATSSGGGGGVSSVTASSNVPTPLFTTSVTNPTTTPTIVFTVSSIPTGHFYSGPYNVLGPGNGSPDVPSFRAIQVGDLPPGISATQIGFGTVNNTEYSYLDGASSNIQDQLNTKGTVVSVGASSDVSTGLFTVSVTNPATTPVVTFAASAVPNRVVYAGPSSPGANASPRFRLLEAADMPTSIPAINIGAGTVDNTELGYLDGASANIQTQLNSKGSGTVTNLTVGNLSPIFTSNVATPTTTPAVTYSLSNVSSGQGLFGPATGAATTPTYRSMVASDMPGTVVNSVGNLSPLFTASISNQALSFVQVAQASGQVLCGPVSGGSANPTFRGLTGLDIQNAVIAGSNVSLAIVPSSGQLQISSTGGGGGGTSLTKVTITGTATASNNSVVLVNLTTANATLYLPNPVTSDNGDIYVKIIGGVSPSPYTLTINASALNGSATMDGNPTLSSTYTYDAWHFKADAATINWYNFL